LDREAEPRLLPLGHPDDSEDQHTRIRRAQKIKGAGTDLNDLWLSGDARGRINTVV
jgi:hypothetical protein